MPLLKDAVKLQRLLDEKVRRKHRDPVQRLESLLLVLWMKADWERRTISVDVGPVTLCAKPAGIECAAPDIRPLQWTACDSDLAVTLFVGGYADAAIEALTKWWESES